MHIETLEEFTKHFPPQMGKENTTKTGIEHHYRDYLVQIGMRMLDMQKSLLYQELREIVSPTENLYERVVTIKVLTASETTRGGEMPQESILTQMARKSQFDG